MDIYGQLWRGRNKWCQIDCHTNPILHDVLKHRSLLLVQEGSDIFKVEETPHVWRPSTLTCCENPPWTPSTKSISKGGSPPSHQRPRKHSLISPLRSSCSPFPCPAPGHPLASRKMIARYYTSRLIIHLQGRHCASNVSKIKPGIFFACAAEILKLTARHRILNLDLNKSCSQSTLL